MRTLDDVVDDLGIGLGQYVVVFLGGELYSGLIKTLVTVSSTSFAIDLGFSSFERGWLVSMLFLGNFIGNLTSGAMSDYCGRRLTLCIGYMVAVVFLGVTLLTSSFTGMMMCRTCVGLAAGIMGPTSWTLIGEISPSKQRMLMHSLGHITWFVGGVSMLLLVHSADPMMQDLPWRHFTFITFCVVLLCSLAAFWGVPESPAYLCINGRRSEAEASLEAIRQRNGVQIDTSNWELRPTEAPAAARAWSYGALFKKSSLFTTMTLCVCTFSLNYSSYGMLYALPIILRKSSLDIYPSTTMLVSLSFGVVGLALSTPVSALAGSRVTLLGWVLLARAVCCIFFLVGIWHGSSSILILALTLSGIFGKTMLDSVTYCLVYLYAIEVQSTESRASSSGMACAVGRLGGVLAPVMFEVLPNSPSSFIISVCVLALACAVLVLGLPIETKDRQLGDIAAESACFSKSQSA